MSRWVCVLLIPALFACSDASTPEGPATEAAAGVRVTVDEPRQQAIDHVLTALGSVESIQHPTISAETAGRIVSIEVREGEPVRAQQLLATIDSTLHSIEADKARAELQRQEVLLDNQQREVERLLHLTKTQSVSKDRLEDEQAQLATLKALRDVARKQQEQALYLESKTRVTSPQDGLVTRRHISLGDYVTPGQALFNLVSVTRLRARIAFPEHQASSISLGKEVRLQTPAARASIAVGTVTSINPQINPRSRAMDIIVEFDNPGDWYPGASVDATLIVNQNPSALTVPLLSVVRRGGEDVVFVVDGEYASQRAVKLGWREGDWVEIVEGLSPGEKLVTEGASLISDGSRLTISMEAGAP